METNGNSKKIKVVFNDNFELCGDFHSMMEYTISFYVKELNKEQLKYLYERGVNTSTSRDRFFVIVEKRLVKEVDFYEY